MGWGGWGLEGVLLLSLIGGHQEFVKHLGSVGEMSTWFYFIFKAINKLLRESLLQ